MVVKKLRSPILTVIQTESFGVPTVSTWEGTLGKVYTPPINGNLLKITTSFNSNDTDASFTLTTRDLSSTNICLVTDLSTNKASATRYPEFYPTSGGSTTLFNANASNSGGIGMKLPICGSLEIGCAGATSGNTCIFELFFETDK